MDFQPLFRPTRQFLDATKGKWKTVETDTGVSYETIKKICDGRIKNPGVLTIERLARYAATQKGQRTRREAERRRG